MKKDDYGDDVDRTIGSGDGPDSGRLTSDELLSVLEDGLSPHELLSRLQNSSAAVWVLWMHLAAVPADRTELRAMLCHIWDGMTSDVAIAERMHVHRHTVRKWRKELHTYIKHLPVVKRDDLQ